MTTTRKLYRLNDGIFVRTLAEIPKDQQPNRVDVPVDSPELCQFLNQLLLDEQRKVPLDADIEQVRFDAPFEPTREQFEEAWENFPLALKCHYASLAMEECRVRLK